MYWISILFIALASNLDNLGIGISLGIRSTKVPHLNNGIIAIITMAGTYVSMMIGQLVSGYIFSAFANVIGAIMIMLIGLWTLYSEIFRKAEPAKATISSEEVLISDSPPPVVKNQVNIISLKETFMLGAALAVNNLAAGFGAGATGISPLWTTLIAGIFSYLFISVGAFAGFRVARTWFGKYANLIAGLLFIAIGIYEILS